MKQGKPELPFQPMDRAYKCPTCNGTGFRAAGWMNRGPTAGWSQCRNVCHACAGSGSVDAVCNPAGIIPPCEMDAVFLQSRARRGARSITRDRWVVFQCASDKPGGVPESAFFDENEHTASLESNGVNSEDLIWMEHRRRQRHWNVRSSDFPSVLRHAMHKATTASDILVRIRARLCPGPSKFELLPDPEPDPVLRPVFADESLELEAWM